MRIGVAIGSACLLVACSSQGSSETVTADISKISQVKSDFGPGYKVKDTPKTQIDPKVLSTHKLPPGLTFDPPDCSAFVVGEDMPPGLQGNMAAVAAEGNGTRFIAMAVQTSQAVPFNEPGPKCKKVAFQGGRLRGLIEVIDAPQINGARTIGVHRILQTVVQGKPRSGELYNYTAHFGDYEVIVTANPVPTPGQPTAAIDTNRARDLLVKSVAAVRS
jgi:uncharacterized protein DUF5642